MRPTWYAVVTTIRLAVLFSFIAIVGAESTAEAYTWWSHDVTTLGSGGPSALSAPTGQPTLGSDFVAIAPYSLRFGNYGMAVLGPCTGRVCSGLDYEVWTYGEGIGWKDTSLQAWGVSETFDVNYLYAWTSPSDSPAGGLAYFDGTNWTPSHNYIKNASMFSLGVGWFAVRYGGTPNRCQGSAPCIYTTEPSYEDWNPNAGACMGPTEMNADEVAQDTYSGSDFTTMVWVYSGVVQYSKTVVHLPPSCPDIELFSYSMSVCSGDGGGTLYAVQVAKKNGVVYALGGTGASTSCGGETCPYTAGPGTVYSTTSPTGCWSIVGGSGTGPATHAVSIAADSGYSTGGGTTSTGQCGVWATDHSNKVYCACYGSTCPKPNGF